jgi:site-specific DNA-methyltransferase (adenine-specific)
MEFENQVFNRDVLEVLHSLPDGSVDTVYGDPDYNVGIDYAGKKYSQAWEDYVAWYVELAKESLRVLKPTGNL